MFNQKGVAHIFFILILLAGIIAGVYLVQKTQVFKPKAAGENIEILDGDCVKVKDGKKILTCDKFQFKVISPLEEN